MNEQFVPGDKPSKGPPNENIKNLLEVLKDKEFIKRCKYTIFQKAHLRAEETHDIFSEVIMRVFNLVKEATEIKNMRSYVKTALNNYIIERRRKKGIHGSLVNIDDLNENMFIDDSFFFKEDEDVFDLISNLYQSYEGELRIAFKKPEHHKIFQDYLLARKCETVAFTLGIETIMVRKIVTKFVLELSRRYL